jgi:hypothetical protein
LTRSAEGADRLQQLGADRDAVGSRKSEAERSHIVDMPAAIEEESHLLGYVVDAGLL